MNVLSLFDGMACGRIALEQIGIKVDNYYASEINPHSIQITQKNYPDTVQLGDVSNLTKELLSQLNIDILIGGSPCTNLTVTVVNNYEHNQGLEGDKSKLFFEYIKIKNWLNPKYFLLENVESMTTENKDIITAQMGVSPVMIDSALVSAQDRKRYYWTNIPVEGQPEDLGVKLSDIMEDIVPDKEYHTQPFIFNGWDKKVIATLDLKTHDMNKRVYNPNMKCGTLTGIRGGYHEKKVYDKYKDRCRKLTPIEYERLQNVPDFYTEGVADSKRRSMLGDGWTIGVISWIFKFLPEEYKIIHKTS